MPRTAACRARDGRRGVFSTILFAASGSSGCDAAARVAFDLAVRYGARFTILHVIEDGPAGRSRWLSPESPSHPRDIGQVRSVLEQAYAPRIRSGVECGIATATGDPVNEVLRYARADGADLIVMGVDSADGLAIGPTLRGVLAASGIPVLAVARSVSAYWGGFANIVFSADFSAPSRSAFSFALGMAESAGTRLRVFHALEEDPGLVPASEFDAMMFSARNRLRREYLEHAEAGGMIAGDVWEGFPGVEIVKYARESQADLIVAAPGRGQTGIGSTLEHVLLRATCPVLAVNGGQPSDGWR